MPRPKSDSKRTSILAAAQKANVREGLSVSTAAIARYAHIATGSLFTYFPTKADLFNAVYVTLKSELAEAITTDGEAQQTKLYNAWSSWTTWAAENTEKHQALELLRISELLTQQSKDFGDTAIEPVFTLIKQCWSANQTNFPAGFIYDVIGAISDVTMNQMVRDPDKATQYRDAGFASVWKLLNK